MKINSIGFYSLNQKNVSNQRVGKYQTATFAAPLKPEQNNNLLYNPMFYPLTFTGKGDLVKPNKLFSLRFQIICPCCGKSMVTPQRFKSKLTEEVLIGSSAKAVKVLQYFEKNMYEIEKLCFKKIKELSAIEPNKTLNQLLEQMRAPSLEDLKINQYKVFDTINQIAEELPTIQKDKLQLLTSEAKHLVNEDKSERPFKRKVFIKKINEIKNEIPEFQIGGTLLDEARQLDNSTNNLNAFIVKYSRRGSKEIGQRLVSKSVATAEHIVPQAKGGKNLLENYISECAGCNNSRGETSLEEWIQNVHPEMVKNMQKHMDLIIDKMNEGRFKDQLWYPEEVAKTLEEESGGLIKLDTSRLTLKANQN